MAQLFNIKNILLNGTTQTPKALALLAVMVHLFFAHKKRKPIYWWCFILILPRFNFAVNFFTEEKFLRKVFIFFPCRYFARQIICEINLRLGRFNFFCAQKIICVKTFLRNKFFP